VRPRAAGRVGIRRAECYRGATAAASPSEATGASPSAEPSGGTGTSLTVTARRASTSGFDPKTLEAPANTPFNLVFDNQTGVMHNVALLNPTFEGHRDRGHGVLQRPGQRTYRFRPGARDYRSNASTPTTMTGTLTVK